VNRSLILAVVGIVLLGALVADAKNIPVTVTAGNVTVSATRVASSVSGYDLLEFYLTGMTGLAAGLNTDGTQCRINAIQGQWVSPQGGAFWIPTNLATLKARSTNAWWENPTYSAVNFDSTVSGATIWTNTAADVPHGLPNGGGRDAAPVGNNYNFFSGSWFTTDYGADLVYPANGGYTGGGTDSRYLAALYITTATPDVGLGYDGVLSFTYSGGTVEVSHFRTTPEPGTLVLVAAGLVGLVAYAWRKRRQ
jgi:hypothetical protein